MAEGERYVHVPARSGAAVPGGAGDIVEVIDLQGKQIVDFFAFNAKSIDEVLSPTHTRTQALRLQLRPGDLLSSNARNPMFALLADTVGRHDLLVAPCDQRRSRLASTCPTTPTVATTAPRRWRRTA